MLRKTLLVGLSTAAMTVVLAAPASAQNSQTNCGGTSGNACTVTQTAGQSNTSTITINSGTGNNVTVAQTGTAETSIVQITGNTNTVNHNQQGVLDVANTTVAGNNNGVAISQFADGAFNTATVSLLGNNNSASIGQSGNANGGSRNTATITAQGNSLRGAIDQNAGISSSSNNTAIVNLGSTAAVSGATLVQNVTLTQRQAGNSASVFVRGGTTGTTAGAEGQNSASVVQQNTLYNSTSGTLGAPTNAANPLTANVIDVSISGQANGAQVNQNGIQNTSTVSINRGAAAVATGTGVDPTNGLNFTVGQSGRNSATINQNGRGNRTSVSIGGRDAAGQQGIGNTLNLTQGTSAAADVGNNHVATAFLFGQLSRVDINQQDNTGTVNSTARQGNSTADVSQSSFSSVISLQQNGSNDASLSQGGGSGATQSGNSRIIVAQVDTGNLAPGSAGPGGGPFDPAPTPGAPVGARNFVAISQAGRGQEANVNQNGASVSATVFQRFNTTAGTATGNGAPGPVQTLSDVYIAQGTAGAAATPQGGQAVDPAPTFLAASVAAAPNATGLNSSLTANVDQGGRGVVAIRQDGSTLSASVSQNPTSNAAIVAGANATVQVSQVGINQSATVNQTGRNSTATVDQRNGNTLGGTNAITSVVQITQSGGGNGTAAGTVTQNQNVAIARQGTTLANGAGGQTGTSAAGSLATGPAGDPDSRAAGSFGNRIEISQTNGSTGTTAATGGNLYAEAEQRGQGQLARITQSGFNNTAQILQDATATNSIALITQSGSANIFFVNQTQANQFLRVNQTGNNNQTVTANGNGGGGIFFNMAPSAGSFTTTPPGQ